MEQRQKLLAEVDARQQQAIEFLRQIISIPSVTGCSLSGIRTFDMITAAGAERIEAETR